MGVSTAGTTHTFTTSASSVAIGQFQVTTAEEDDKVSFSFTIVDRALKFRVGSTSGGQEIVSDSIFPPGTWVVSFTPGETTYYVQFQLDDVGTAQLVDFQREAAADLSLATVWAKDDLSLVRVHQSLNVVYNAICRASA